MERSVEQRVQHHAQPIYPNVLGKVGIRKQRGNLSLNIGYRGDKFKKFLCPGITGSGEYSNGAIGSGSVQFINNR